MTIALTINGSTYFYPENGDTRWGPEATDWAAGVTTGMLQKAGGLFQLLGEVDFGITYGLKANYFKSRSSDIASLGVLRLARTDTASWRNNANDGDLDLTVNASDELTFNGAPLGRFYTVTDTDSIDLTLAAGDLSADIVLSSDSADSGYQLVEMEVRADGVFAQSSQTFSAITLTGASGVIIASAGVLSSEAQLSPTRGGTGVNNSGTFTYGSNNISLTTSGPTSLTLPTSGTVLVNTDTIPRSSIANGTPNHVLINSGTGAMSSEANLAISRGGTGAGTKAAAMDALSPQTTKGDLIGFSTTAIRVAVGSNGQVLTADSGQTSGLGWSSPLTNPMDSEGDMIVGGTAGAATKLDAGTANQVLQSNGAASPSWVSIVNANIDASAAIEGSKIVSASASVAGVVDTGTQSFSGDKTIEGTLYAEDGLKGDQTGNAIPAGFIGETLRSNGSTGAITSTAATNCTSLSITQGTWRLQSTAVLINASNLQTTPGLWESFMTTTSSPTISNAQGTIERYACTWGDTANNSEQGSLHAECVISVTTTTTWYMHGKVTNYSSGSGVIRFTLLAQRIA